MRYEGPVKDGGILISVHCDSPEEVDCAKEILKAAGGEDIPSGKKAVSSHTYNAVDRSTKTEVGRGTY
jgi:hypothetical protein